jgi:hypothetical protein
MRAASKSKKISSPAIAKPKKNRPNTVNPNLSLARLTKDKFVQECGTSINPKEFSEREAALSNFHPEMLAGVAYSRLSKKMLPGDKLLAAAFGAGLELQMQQRPTSVVERLALAQLLLAYGRLCWLTELLAKQIEPSATASISRAVESSARTFELLLRSIPSREIPARAILSDK